MDYKCKSLKCLYEISLTQQTVSSTTFFIFYNIGPNELKPKVASTLWYDSFYDNERVKGVFSQKYLLGTRKPIFERASPHHSKIG